MAPAASPDQLDVNSLISQLQAAQDCSTISVNDSTRLLRAARKLVITLENPATKLVEIAKGPVAHAALRVALKISLFEAFDKQRATAKELAHRCDTDPLLMVRIMRALLCIGIFDEDGEEAYIHNVLSKPLMNPAARAQIRGMAETTDIMPKLPDYLASLEYRNPNDRHNSFFGFAHQTDLNMYEWLQAHPEQMRTFNDFQSANAQLNEASVQGVLESLITQPEHNNDQVLFVDVGGGRGKSLRTFRKNHRQLTGGIIVQDLPKVIEGQEVEEGVETIAHDFFSPQPVKGMHFEAQASFGLNFQARVLTPSSWIFLPPEAPSDLQASKLSQYHSADPPPSSLPGARIYFFRFVLHNWPDSACRQILHHTTSAMTPTSPTGGSRSPSSKLIIIDLLLPPIDAGPFETLMDLQMIAFGGMERTEKQWRDLLEGEGLRIERFVKPQAGTQIPECLIECVVIKEEEEEEEEEKVMI